ncbi:MAG: DUF2807 domain-containing protein [Bacteroidetes bacterium]|jgi:hypothetical protein|nr:DUF2807 domain-containing protein [Bacteroidota bacterium]
MNILKLSHFLIISACILFTSCEKECSDTISESFLASNFHTIKAGDDHRITLKEASSWSVKATGCEEDINALKVYVINGELSISYPDDYEVNELVKFTIGAPTFSTLILEEKAACTINGFIDSTEQHTFILSGTSSCSYTGNASYLDVMLSGNSDMTVAGIIHRSGIFISGESTYDARNTSGNIAATIDANSESTGYVFALDTLTAEASGTSRIYYKGDPTVKNFTEIGQGKILPL